MNINEILQWLAIIIVLIIVALHWVFDMGNWIWQMEHNKDILLILDKVFKKHGKKK